MSGLVFTLLLATAAMDILSGILTSSLGFETLARGETWRRRVREGRWNVEVYIKRLGRELQLLLPDSSVPREVCEMVVKQLSARIHSLLENEAFNPDYVKVVGPTPSFCHHYLESVYMPFRCHRCGGFFCSGHRLPERHNCPGGEEKAQLAAIVEEDEEGFEKPGKPIMVKEIPCG
ncbi:MAG: AN1-type zinc finger domain-containing protein [Candidatus Bathyarchaeota archaeon]|nr:AN1-type zinc finger domain-containing protein [Candidatus Bathyarchaeota archaeon]